MLRIKEARPLPDYKIRVKLTDGTSRTLDLRLYLKGPFLKQLLNEDLFDQVEVVHGTLSWPTGQDLDPDVLLQTEFYKKCVKLNS